MPFNYAAGGPLTHEGWKWAQKNFGRITDAGTGYAPSGVPWELDPFSREKNHSYQNYWMGTGQEYANLDPSYYPAPRAIDASKYPWADRLDEYRNQQNATRIDSGPGINQTTPQNTPANTPTNTGAGVNTPSNVPGLSNQPAPYQRPDMPAMPTFQSSTSNTLQQYQRPEFNYTPPPQFQGTMQAPNLMTLEEMMENATLRANMAYDAPMEAKERMMQEEMMRGEQQKGEVQNAYTKAMEDLRKSGQTYQQASSDQMRSRNIYDSGLAMETSNRIHMSMLKSGAEISSQEAKVLSDLAEYLDLRQRHTNEELQSMMGEKAMFAQSVLEEMRQRNESRRDMLAQQEFENWLGQEHMNAQHHQMQQQEYWRSVGFDAQQVQQQHDNYWREKQFEWQQYETQLGEYWRQVGFDAQAAQQEYQRFWDQANFEWDQYIWQNSFDAQQAQFDWQKQVDQQNMDWQQKRAEMDDYWKQQSFDAQQAQSEYQKYLDQMDMDWRQRMAERDDHRWGQEFDSKQHELSWDRINSMNRWEAEMELAKLQYNNQLSQQQFQNALALNDQGLKEALYKAQYGTI